jgi:hypothetical protein
MIKHDLFCLVANLELSNTTALAKFSLGPAIDHEVSRHTNKRFWVRVGVRVSYRPEVSRNTNKHDNNKINNNKINNNKIYDNKTNINKISFNSNKNKIFSIIILGYAIGCEVSRHDK